MNLESILQASREDKSKRNIHLQWDEETIAKHDKERGTRQKIDEPPTPYEYGSDRELSDDELEGSEFVSDNDNLNKISNSLTGALSIKDNWENINAKLNFHHQQQIAEDEIKNSNLTNDESNNNNNITTTENIFNFGKPDLPILDFQYNNKFTIDNNNNLETNDDEEDKNKFKNKRSSHYNEFKMIQAMKAKMALEEEEDEED